MHARALLLATAFGLLGVGSVFMYTKQLRAEISGGERIAVLMLSKPAKKGSTLSDEQIAVREVPIAYLDDRIVRANDRPKILGVRLDRDIDPQQMLEWADLALDGAGERHLGDLVPPGNRALTLHIPANFMSIKLLRPGDYVDLVAIVNEDHTAPEAVALLQKVLVLAVGTDTTPAVNAKADGTRQIDQLLTVSVTLQQGQAIALATQKGPVMALLRSPGDTSVASQIPALSHVVVHDPGPQKAAPPKEPTKPAELKAQPRKP
jgi:pilus assembly protein CpaB